MHSITVLIPNLNGGIYLENAIESVLNQTINVQILVVDNGSSDNSLDILKRYKVQYSNLDFLVEKNQGISAALNRGLSKINTDFTARLDSDDLMNSERLERQLNEFSRDKNLVLVGSNLKLVDSHGFTLGERKYPKTNEQIQRCISFMNPIAHSSALIKTAELKLCGGYNSNFDGAEDLDLWFRLRDYGEFLNIQDSLTLYRLHSMQSTKKKNLYKMELRVRFHYYKSHRNMIDLMVLLRFLDLLFTSFGFTQHRLFLRNFIQKFKYK